MNTIACVLRSGGCFDYLWVQRLKRKCNDFLPKWQFSVITDFEARFPDTHTTILNSMWPGWWSKIHLFDPRTFQADDRILYLDLDTLVLGPIHGLDKLDWTKLHMLSDFLTPARPASGVMAWSQSEATERIYHDFCKVGHRHINAGRYARIGPQKAFGDGGFIGQYPHVRLQSVMPGVFQSVKKDGIMEKGPGNWPVICFHGSPRFTELAPDHWARKHWEGSK